MKIRYFADTDTMYLELNDRTVAETREIKENTLLDLIILTNSIISDIVTYMMYIFKEGVYL